MLNWFKKKPDAGTTSSAGALLPDTIAAATALKEKGDALLDTGQWHEAVQPYVQALAQDPQFAAVRSNLGFALMQLHRYDEASEQLELALTLDAGLFNARYLLATIARRQARTGDALRHAEAAIAIRPAFAEAWSLLGDLRIEMEDRDGACAAYQQVLELDPGSASALSNLGSIAEHRGERRKALAFYGRALALEPGNQSVRLNLLHQQFQLADWAGVENEIALLRQAMLADPASEDNRASPFSFLALPGTTAAEQKRCAEKWAYAMYRPLSQARAERGFADRLSSGKPHIAYLSADFHDHATARLMIEVFERHDRERFRFTAYAYGPKDDSAMTARLEQAFERIVDIRGDSVFEAAAKIRADGVDILVDLKGYTGASRSDILALCPAPIQVNYLGYPGTMGADFVDYLIADRFLIPQAQQEHYSERIAYLPDTYQPTDGRRVRPAAPSRAAQGLPEHGFVFCCFNQVYKITPVMMDVWCTLLRDVAGSVLWLIGSDAFTEDNLRSEAVRRGVAHERIVFAPRTDAQSHLARHGCADLFLDTSPYNAHTTCSDALWMGLPVLTCAGDTFPARVAGSLLQALGVPELITYDLEQYRTLALAVARDDVRLKALRGKIAAARDSAALFDAARFTRNLELVYQGMLDEYPNGK